MKYLFLFLLMYLLPINLAGGTQPDSLARLADRARLFGERIPQEKVYVQMDNTGYFLGDTVWFAAYTRRTDTGRPSRVSRVLYAELWNHDGFLVERKLVEMRDGRGHGFFALPDTLYSGYFELRAYTRWQLNWGQTEHPHNKHTEQWFYNKEMAKDYFRDYEKLYSRVFPVYDKPQEAGQYVRDMTLRPLRRYFRKDEKKPGLVLSLFPEGGSLTAGVPCRVAFEAATEEGEAMQGRVSLQIKNEEIRIKNWQGEEVTEVCTEHRGRGSFTFVPEAGRTYEAVFVTEGGETAKAGLGDIAREGVALQVTREDSVWRFQIQSSLDRPLGLALMHEGVTSHFLEIKDEEIRIKDEGLPTGVNQVTVFDEEGRVWADRLFFVMKPEATSPTLTVTGLKEEYEPYEQVNLTLKAHAPTLPHDGEEASISLAVRDAVRQDRTFDSGNILTEMLLSSEIKGFVPQPEWYFESDDAEHRRGLDLLMMTQGWRRFQWRDMAVPGAWEITHPAEQSQTVTGSVNKYYVDNITRNLRKRYSEGKMKREVVVLAKFIKLDENHKTIGRKAITENGHFSIELPSFYGTCLFFLSASDSTKWRKRWNKMNKKRVPHNKKKKGRFADIAEFYVRTDFSYPRFIKPYTYYQTHQAVIDAPYFNENPEKDTTYFLNEVTIKSKHNGQRRLFFHKPAYVVDAYEAGNAAMDAGLITNLYHTTPMAYGIAMNYIGDMNSARRYPISVYYDDIRFRYNELTSGKTIENAMMPVEQQSRYEQLNYLEYIYIYTDIYRLFPTKGRRCSI